MGASNTTCMSIAKTASSELGLNTSKAPVKKLSDESFEAWVGEWTYIVRNEVHSFDITVQDGKLVYLENMGMTTMRGNVFPTGKTAKIVAKKMNFEIFLDRSKMIARYRAIGTKKWTKEISVLKVDEIDSETEHSLDWQASTLKNTWRNQSMHEKPEDVTSRKGLVRDGSYRGSSLRRAISLKKHIEDQPSEDIAEMEELVRRNTSRRSIRFGDDVKKELRDLLDVES